MTKDIDVSTENVRLAVRRAAESILDSLLFDPGKGGAGVLIRALWTHIPEEKKVKPFEEIVFDEIESVLKDYKEKFNGKRE